MKNTENLNNNFVSESIKKSAQIFVANPDGVEAYIDFCDALIARGCNMKEAIEKTDSVFEILHQKETYKD